MGGWVGGIADGDNDFGDSETLTEDDNTSFC
jgi:hypothetical protein